MACHSAEAGVRIGWRDPWRDADDSSWRHWPTRGHWFIVWDGCEICGQQGVIIYDGEWIYCPKCLGVRGYMRITN